MKQYIEALQWLFGKRRGYIKFCVKNYYTGQYSDLRIVDANGEVGTAHANCYWQKYEFPVTFFPLRRVSARNHIKVVGDNRIQVSYFYYRTCEKPANPLTARLEAITKLRNQE